MNGRECTVGSSSSWVISWSAWFCLLIVGESWSTHIRLGCWGCRSSLYRAPPKLYTSFHSHQFHSEKYKIMYLTQCQVMNFFISYHHKSLYLSCSILKQTLGSAQESKEFSNEMTEIYPHESAGFEFHSVCHHHLKFGKSVSVRFQLYLKIKNIHNKIKQDVFSYFKK